MIDSARVDLARSECSLADGLLQWVHGDEGPNAIAAGRILAETVIMWRVVLRSKLQT